MITKSNFKDLLIKLGFRAENNIYQKSIGQADLKVNFNQQLIIYPEDRGLKVNERQTCNFSHNENFVVFECVHRLLEKGYKPEHLELEPRWKVGRGASGGRADILVRDQKNNPLLIIECKTAGDEFEKAWDKTRQDGDQLFGYAQQISETQFLCLYTSNFTRNGLDFDYKIIPHRDNPEILEQDTTLLSFAQATNVKDRFAVWHNTYKLAHTTGGVFEGNIQAYQIGKNNYTLADDTKDIDTIDKEGKYHEFRTILRKHNIARRENAFEVLVNLFLCKIVDEEDNKANLKFYWKGIAYDNYFDFVDRLQDLYQKGMSKFLNEKISYISNEQIDNAFWTVKNKRNATKQQIQAYFRELKFFTNSAFSFLDTHNEELFNKNVKVLLEIVQMWQGLRLKTDDQNQFLGEMFERFLDDGVKQSEGQFFTPLPICKFIVASLPLSEKIETSAEPIKAIDYACGAGHFLNEYAHQIKPLVAKQERKLSDYYSQITGIEKEDRLAKVAKVAAYMHGQEQIKILEADALASHPEIPLASFDVLVANPPFAVEGFLQTLGDENKKHYQLIQVTGGSSNTNAIQCFFLERVHHLMAPGGLVGLIVPISILSTTDAVHIHTRELLLQFFDIVSIVELGNRTFGKTGTNTVVLFLRRKMQKPEVAEHYANRVEDFFEGDSEDIEYQDNHLIKAYCNHIEVSYEEYIKLFAQTSLGSLTELLQYDIFKEYQQDFDQSTQVKNLKKSNKFKKKTQTEQYAELAQRFIAYLHAIEKDKLYYFILAHEQDDKVLIVNAPSGETKKKQFLGYRWSGSKGSEGIKYEGGATVNDIITPLFDPKDLDNGSKINTAIKNNFVGKTTAPLPEYCHYAKLTDMLDFSRKDFNKVISLRPKQNTNIETKWEQVKLGEVIVLYDHKRKPISSSERTTGIYPYYGATGIIDYVDEYIFDEDLVLIGEDGAKWGANEPTAFLATGKYWVNNHAHVFKPEEKKLEYTYIIELLNFLNLDTFITGYAPEKLNQTNLKEIKIPLPPLEVQQQIADKCEAVDTKTDQALQTITTAEQKIEKKVQAVVNSGYEMKKLGYIAEKLIAGGDIPQSNVSKDKTDKFNIPIFANGVQNKGLYGYTDLIKITKPSITISARGTIGYTEIRNEMFYPIGRLIVLIPNTDLVNILFLKHIMSTIDFTYSGSVIHQLTLPEVRDIKIPVPSLNIQQKLVTEFEQLEAKITQAQTVIDNATTQKNVILTNYL